jgi:signal transduction histidine kinase
MTDQEIHSVPPQTTGLLPGITEICRLIADSVDWKVTLDQMLPYIRRMVLFDNFALYHALPVDQNGEIIYAKALGRGKTTGEDLSWGDATAALVFESRKAEINQPLFSDDQEERRLDFPYIIGTPVNISSDRYAMVLIRFGGPEYTPADKQSLQSVTYLISLLLKQKQMNDKMTLMEAERQQALLQEDFISTISHELLSPIGFIKGYTTTLLRADTTWNPEMQQEFLAIINEETDRLQELINNILDSARLQTGSLSMDSQPVRLDTLLRDVTMRAIMHQTNIKIETNISQQLPQIQGDSRRLTQVFENLISNCIKYAPGSKLTISAEVVHGQIHIAFTDNGPGIAPRYIPNLFQKFFRSPDSSTEIRGTGLGLYICRQIIEAHHGEIFAESDLGKGTTIHIVLPMNAATNKQE